MEVLVALAVLALGLTAVIQAVTSNQDAVLTAREMTLAGTLAASKMDEIEAVGLDEWFQTGGDFEVFWPGFSWELDRKSHDLDGLRLAVLSVRYRGKNLVDLERVFLAVP